MSESRAQRCPWLEWHSKFQSSVLDGNAQAGLGFLFPLLALGPGLTQSRSSVCRAQRCCSVCQRGCGQPARAPHVLARPIRREMLARGLVLGPCLGT